MRPDHFAVMADYNRWANGLLYDNCAGLDDAGRKLDRSAFFGSIHNTLSHILIGDRIWLGRIEGVDVSGIALDDVPHEAFGDLREAREAEDGRVERVVAGMSPETVAGDLVYHNQSGAEFRTPMSLVLTHMFNHQTHHRGQVHAMLSQAGAEPPGIDLIYYLRSR